MANQQLVDYIKSQLQMGVMRETLKSTLVGSGWPEADVKEAMDAAGGIGAAPKIGAVAGPGSVSPTSSPLGGGPKSTPVITSDIFQPKSSEPVFQSKRETSAPLSGTGSVRAAAPASPAMIAAPPKGSSKKTSVVMLVVGILIGGGVAGAFFYTTGGVPGGRVATQTAENAALAAKVSMLTKERDDARADASRLEQAGAGLVDEISVFASASTSTEPVQFSMEGIVGGGGKALYTVTSPRGVVVSVKNSKDAKVDAALKPLVGNQARISGTHVPASREITVVAVNGQAL